MELLMAHDRRNRMGNRFDQHAAFWYGVILPLVVGLFTVPLMPTSAFGQGAASTQSERYIYDDLDRLYQAIHEDGSVTTYHYDAVGNILSIENSATGTQAPVITTVAPTSGNRGSRVQVTITGTGLAAAAIASAHPALSVDNVIATANQIKATLDIGFDAPIGAIALTIRTSFGTSETQFNILGVAPSLAQLNPQSGPVTRVVEILGSGFFLKLPAGRRATTLVGARAP